MSYLSTILPDEHNLSRLPCGFLRGTRILTPGGLRPVEMLRPGDMVSCASGGPMVLSGVRRRVVARPKARVVGVMGQARGSDHRAARLLLAAEQLIVVAGDRLVAAFGVEEALAPVGALVNGQDLRLVDAPPADAWFEFETASPCALVVEGLYVAVGDATCDDRPRLSEAEARLLAFAL